MTQNKEKSQKSTKKTIPKNRSICKKKTPGADAQISKMLDLNIVKDLPEKTP